MKINFLARAHAMRTEQVSLLLTAPPAAVAPSGQLISKSCFANESIVDEK